MDPFEEFESQNRNVVADETDPAAEFLAREQAEFELIEKGANSLSLDGLQKSVSNSSLDMKNVSNSNPYDAVQQIDRQINEPEKIKRWREEQRQRIETKDAEEERKKKEWKEKAKKDLEDWYKNRNEQLVISIQNNREANKKSEGEFMEQREAPTQPGQEWDKISKLCDFNPKANKNQKDISRMRTILLQLKQQPLVRSS